MSGELIPIRVFVASPSDVYEERERVSHVVAELNRTVARRLGAVMQTVRWETDAWPSVGKDAQDVINRQIRDPDVFVGIMWKSIGTETARAESGTVEEFGRALEQHKTASEACPAILFYVCRRPFSSKSLSEANQLTKVLRFLERIKKAGVLFWEYSDVAEFERFIREHLLQHLFSWFKVKGHGPLFVEDLPEEREGQQKWRDTLAKRNSKVVQMIADAIASRPPVGVIFFDMDNFKRSNDFFGESRIDQAVDIVRRKVVQIIARKGKLYQYFGDEFVIIMPNANLIEAAATAERIRAAIEASGDPRDVSLTASFGVASAVDSSIPPLKIFEDVRTAAFVSKIKGKNCLTTLPISARDQTLIEEVRARTRSPS